MRFLKITDFYLGYSRNINPFDQPAVEGVKILTKKILTSK